MKKIKKLITLFTLTMLLVFSGITIYTKVDANIDIEKNSEEIIFLDDNDSKNAINYIENDASGSFTEEKNYIKNDLLKVTFKSKDELLKQSSKKDNTSSYAFDISYIKKDFTLKETIKNLSKNGNMIYIYGDGLSLKEYNELLEVDNFTIFDENQKNEFKNNTTAVPKLGIEGNDLYDVIGYNINDINSLYLCKITTSDKNSKNIDTKPAENFKLINGVLEDKIKKIKNKLQSNKSNPIEVSTTEVPTIKKDIAFADSQIVISAPHQINTYYVGSVYLGKVDTFWVLLRDYSEHDVTYDYFSIQTNYDVSSSTSMVKSLDTNHSIGTGDAIYDWGPDDISNSTFSVSIPWGITYSFTNFDSTSYTINECGSQTNDYGRWIVTPRFWQSFLANYQHSCRFKPGTAWCSSGTYAMIDTSIKIEFFNNTYGYYTYTQTIKPRYDY